MAYEPGEDVEADALIVGSFETLNKAVARALRIATPEKHHGAALERLEEIRSVLLMGLDATKAARKTLRGK